ncbi:MAG: class I SAM-dependent methyltransferase [Kiritimatiellae bacterium]|nr:class I SAM-dependent methyltransferase [Kiritimatiellia bacterium]
MEDYELLDSGGGRKLERFGRYVLARPCSQALWKPALPVAEWGRADASFDREDGNRWHGRSNLPKEWTIETAGIKLRLGGTDFGHLGVFPEQRAQWGWIRRTVRAACAGGAAPRVLNLFAYSGGSTLAAALGGAEVCHLDASRGMVDWARENARLNGLAESPIRWIVDDAHKFMRREVRRGRRYDAVVLDPPTFGRGAGGEMYKIERDLGETLGLVKELLSDRPLFVLFSSHTPGLSRVVAENLLSQLFPSAGVESGEMLLEGRGMKCPSGVYCRAVFGIMSAKT